MGIQWYLQIKSCRSDIKKQKLRALCHHFFAVAFIWFDCNAGFQHFEKMFILWVVECGGEVCVYDAFTDVVYGNA